MWRNIIKWKSHLIFYVTFANMTTTKRKKRKQTQPTTKLEWKRNI